jgi:hypothetical protein
MALHDFEYFLQNAKAYESLTVDQIYALGRGELIEYGETAPVESEKAVEPEKSTESTETPAAESDETPDVTKTVETEVLAKDGKHTIPYSELEDVRAKAKQFEELSKTQADLIENLKAAKIADAATGDTDAQDDVLKDFKTQYPELAEMLAPVLQTMIDAKASELEKQFTDTLAPIKKSAEDNSIDMHFAVITEAVPDFDALVESGEVKKWIEGLPGYAKFGAERVMTEGTAPEIVELFEQYKAAVAKTSSNKTEEQIEAAANDAILKAKGAKPVSLSDVPAGQVSSHDEEPTTTEGWSRKFAGMTPEAILKML